MQEIEPAEFNNQLIRGLTHKMNNILSLFHGYLGMLMDDEKLSSDTLSGLERIREGAFAASELMDRAQSLVRPRNLVLRELDLRELVMNARMGLETLATRGILIQVGAEEQPIPVLADVSRLRSALSELVSNAVEASPDNSTVRVSAAMEAGGGVISIANQGEEISPETLEKIFEPFFTTRQKRSALGLGLPIASAMATQVGGFISFERIGAETVFAIRIPAMQGMIS